MGLENEELYENLQNYLDDLFSELYGLFDQLTKVKSNLKNIHDQKENECSIITLKLIRGQILKLEEYIKYTTEKEDYKYGVQLQELDEQIKYEKKRLEDQKQLYEYNNVILEKSREEVEKKKSELKVLKKETTDQESKLKELKEDIEHEEGESKKLEWEITNEENKLKNLDMEERPIQQRLQLLIKQNVKKEQVLEKLKQKIIDTQTVLDAKIADEAIIQIHSASSISSTETTAEETVLDNDSDDYIESSENLFEELNAATKQEKITANKETQTQKEYQRAMWYMVYFTIPFALTGVSLTTIALGEFAEKGWVDNSILLSVGLSLIILPIIYCFVAIKLCECCSPSNSDLPQGLRSNLRENNINIGENVKMLNL